MWQIVPCGQKSSLQLQWPDDGHRRSGLVVEGYHIAQSMISTLIALVIHSSNLNVARCKCKFTKGQPAAAISS